MMPTFLRFASLSCALTLGATLVLSARADEGGRQDAAGRFTLRGTVITPSEVLQSALVEVRGDRIGAVAAADAAGAANDVIDVDGVIVPGLVDLHNHLTWNVLPRWTPPRLFANRYEWQEQTDYALKLSGPHYALTAAGFGCDMNRYGEIKAIVHGASAGVGGLSNPNENACVAGLLRNLDLASDFTGGGPVNRERLRNVIFPFESDAATEEAIRCVDPASADGSGTLRAVVMHVAEGVDAPTRREFRMLRAHGFLRHGVSISHALGFGSAQFAELAAARVGLVWSPRSNIELYGRTTDMVAAKQAGVTIAIAPDWSPTGSAGMLDELAVAWKLNVGQFNNVFTDAEMFKMATTNPAALAGLGDTIGSVAPGFMADLLVLRRKERSAYQAVLRSTAGDVRLMVVGGRPLYGDEALMTRMLPGVTLERTTVCGEPKALNVSGGAPALTLAAVSQKLQTALRGIGSALSPLAECP